jgi:uncharacterized protein (TIGR00251 family)
MLEEQASSDGKVIRLLLNVKVVPGSSRDQISGKLGDRLKIKVAAAPEKGGANQAVIALVARTLGLPLRNISVIAGLTSPEKTLMLTGITKDTAALKLLQ